VGYLSGELYLNKAIQFGKLENIFTNSKLVAPAPSDFHPEVDLSDFLKDNEITFYHSYVGILQWAIELGHIDFAYAGLTIDNLWQHPVRDIWLHW
jgi:hypothetical protein